VTFRLTYALFDNPQNALLALATHDDRARARLSSMRYVFGGIANIVVAGAFVPLWGRGGGAQAGVFALFSAALAILAAVSAAALWLQLRARSGPQPPGTRPTLATPTRPVVAEPSPRRWPIFLSMFALSAATSIFSRLEPYFATYGLKSPVDGGTLMVCIAIGGLVSQPFWSWWARRWSLVSALQSASVGVIAGALAFGLGAQHGLAMAALSGGLYGWGCGGALMSLWALAAAASRRSDRTEAATATFGWLTFSAKVAMAISAFGIGEAFAAIDYRAQANGLLLGSMAAAPLLAGLCCLGLSRFVRPAGPGRSTRPLRVADAVVN
jgi:Na+/melibiose symporter-like transporter